MFGENGDGGIGSDLYFVGIGDLCCFSNVSADIDFESMWLRLFSTKSEPTYDNLLALLLGVIMSSTIRKYWRLFCDSTLLIVLLHDSPLDADKADVCGSLVFKIPELNGSDLYLVGLILIELCVLLTMSVASATAERSFSVLRCLKTYVRSTMKNDRLSSPGLMHVHLARFWSELVQSNGGVRIC